MHSHRLHERCGKLIPESEVGHKDVNSLLSTLYLAKSLILAQDERWRRG
jgi:hypothetical protein